MAIVKPPLKGWLQHRLNIVVLLHGGRSPIVNGMPLNSNHAG